MKNVFGKVHILELTRRFPISLDLTKVHVRGVVYNKLITQSVTEEISQYKKHFFLLTHENWH